jgi:precorrin-3B methylase
MTLLNQIFQILQLNPSSDLATKITNNLKTLNKQQMTRLLEIIKATKKPTTWITTVLMLEKPPTEAAIIEGLADDHHPNRYMGSRFRPFCALHNCGST